MELLGWPNAGSAENNFVLLSLRLCLHEDGKVENWYYKKEFAYSCVPSCLPIWLSHSVLLQLSGVVGSYLKSEETADRLGKGCHMTVRQPSIATGIS